MTNWCEHVLPQSIACEKSSFVLEISLCTDELAKIVKGMQTNLRENQFEKVGFRFLHRSSCCEFKVMRMFS